MDSSTDNVKQLATAFEKATDKVKEMGEELKGRMAKGEKGLEDLKGRVDESLTSFNSIKTRLEDVEQKQNRLGDDGAEQVKSIGDQIFENENFQRFAQDPRSVKSARIEVKELVTSATTDAAGSAGALITPDRRPGLVLPPEQQLTVRDLISSGRTNSNQIEYMQETGFTNGAAAQAKEGDLKAETEIQYSEATASVRTLAHWIRASKQVLEDAPMLESYIKGRLMYGLKLVEDRQLLNGDGTSGNLLGLIPQSTEFADPTDLAEYSILDQLRLAMLQAVLAEYPATGHVLNPIDWTRIELTKDTIGRYIIGQPDGTANHTMWGLPVVSTQAMAQGKFLTGAFGLAAQIFDRMDAAIILSTEDRDNFVRNLVTILCEERLGLAVYRPEALIYGTLAPKVAAA